jgi:hypothetical protein
MLMCSRLRRSGTRLRDPPGRSHGNVADQLAVHVAALDGLLALMRSASACGPASPRARLGTFPAFACPRPDQVALELGKPAQHGQHQLPCDVVVSAHASPKDRRKPALRSVIAASVFNRSRVDRASRSRRVTISTSAHHRSFASRSRGEAGRGRPWLRSHARHGTPSCIRPWQLPRLRVNALALAARRYARLAVFHGVIMQPIYVAKAFCFQWPNFAAKILGFETARRPDRTGSSGNMRLAVFVRASRARLRQVIRRPCRCLILVRARGGYGDVLGGFSLIEIGGLRRHSRGHLRHLRGALSLLTPIPTPTTPADTEAGAKPRLPACWAEPAGYWSSAARLSLVLA